MHGEILQMQLSKKAGLTIIEKACSSFPLYSSYMYTVHPCIKPYPHTKENKI